MCPIQAAWIHVSSRPHPRLWPHVSDLDMVEYLDLDYVPHASHCLQTQLVELLNWPLAAVVHRCHLGPAGKRVAWPCDCYETDDL